MTSGYHHTHSPGRTGSPHSIDEGLAQAPPWVGNKGDSNPGVLAQPGIPSPPTPSPRWFLAPCPGWGLPQHVGEPAPWFPHPGDGAIPQAGSPRAMPLAGMISQWSTVTSPAAPRPARHPGNNRAQVRPQKPGGVSRNLQLQPVCRTEVFRGPSRGPLGRGHCVSTAYTAPPAGLPQQNRFQVLGASQ